MQIVINIPEELYTRLLDNGRPMDFADGIVMDRAIRNGILLEEYCDSCVYIPIESEVIINE